MIPIQNLDIAAVRARLKGSKGKMYWRTLEEFADTDEFETLLHNEFPRQAIPMPDGMSRRQFVKLMGASLALAGLSGCGTVGGHWRVPEKIVPYVEAPEYIVPGKPLMFATAMSLGGVAIGLLAESHTGRPTKLEGNPTHPGSLGSTDIFSQAAILELYDPDRAETIMNQGRIRTWQNFTEALDAQLATDGSGAGLRLVTEAISSPSLADQINQVLEAYPEAKWITWEPAGNNNAQQGAELAFGQPANTVYDFTEADVVLALDADFLSAMPGNVRYTRDFMARRRVSDDSTTMSRLYVVEPMLTPTGSTADHRLPMRASDVAAFGQALGNALGAPGFSGDLPEGVPAEWFVALVSDLQAAGSRAAVIVGESQAPIVHAIGHALNSALGSVGTTVRYTEALSDAQEDQNSAMQELVSEIADGTVQTLLILGGNPVFTAPGDLDFADALSQVPLSAHLTLYRNETTALCEWMIPAAHFLETWGDARAYDGTVSIMQPLIEPLYGGHTLYEMVGALNGGASATAYDAVRSYWEGQLNEDNFERAWRRAVHDGIVPDSAAAEASVSVSSDFLSQQSDALDAESLEVVFRPDPTLYDGRFANLGWLQELPKPIVKLTWDNAAIVSPSTAERLGLAQEAVVELEVNGRSVEAPILIAPGHADNSVTVWLGGGREIAGRVGEEIGFNAYSIRPAATPWYAPVTINATAGTHRLAVTQEHHQITHHLSEREIIKGGTLSQFEEDPSFLKHGGHGAEEEVETPADSEEHAEGGEEEAYSLYKDWEYTGYKWGMTIDLTTCTGCMACVASCQAENNIPVVGKTEVLRNRELHWLRVDSYYTGDLDNPEVYNMPVPCMQCEKAPCEPVCPVAATVHDSEGLNNMVYNRCIGTRYCSNNCPYKVRRFNYLHYVPDEVPVLKLLRNPDVTVRARGIMEKCTYCIQRISSARIEADKAQRRVEDGEIQTACQATCPAQAITFGDLNDESAAVTARAASPLNYALLEELGTRPRTTYLAAIRNTNDAISDELAIEEHG